MWVETGLRRQPGNIQLSLKTETRPGSSQSASPPPPSMSKNCLSCVHPQTVHTAGLDSLEILHTWYLFSPHPVAAFCFHGGLLLLGDTACVNKSIWPIHFNHYIVFHQPLRGKKTHLLPGCHMHITGTRGSLCCSPHKDWWVAGVPSTLPGCKLLTRDGTHLPYP